jgi:hypothetical protein
MEKGHPMKFPIDNDFDDDMEQTPSQTEDSAERGFVKHQESAHDPETYRNLGRSEELDGDTGDIADEGRGHRG